MQIEDLYTLTLVDGIATRQGDKTLVYRTVRLRETTIAPDTRRLIQLTIADGDETQNLLDMLLAKKRAADRKVWLEKKGDLAEV